MDSLNPIYRAWFLYIDPTFGIAGPAINTFFPDVFLRMFNPEYESSPSIETRLALDTISAFGLGLLVFQVLIPRKKPLDLWYLRLLTVGHCCSQVVPFLMVQSSFDASPFLERILLMWRHRQVS